jgi:hypothetical protein
MRVRSVAITVAGTLPLELVTEPFALCAAELLGLRLRHTSSKGLLGIVGVGQCVDRERGNFQLHVVRFG